ncbi:hypothetical protein AB0K93_11100 [Streptomyces sp. NPDC052676]|uniref:hypothetical protein n=1 Tax=Streptomyces sp. NPDC052676 TaxID=3154953 RepID=UPI00344A1153
MRGGLLPGGETRKAATAMVSSSEGWAVDAIEKHWGKVRSGHAHKVPELRH